MKIAIIAPSPVPFTIGGAEKLWWGLLDAINQAGEHQAELIKMPSPERNFSELMTSYQHFSELDLSHFDRVISTKYPAWMVQHPDHHCYLQHKLRGLYDTYHFTGKSVDLPSLQAADPFEIKQLYTLLSNKIKTNSMLAEFWSIWQSVEKLLHHDLQLNERFSFPGPLTRCIIHFLDDIALQPGNIKRYSAISDNITHRADYFPEGVAVHVIHHPSDLTGFYTSTETETPYIFTISRLDGPKRLDLLIQAFMNTKADIQFRIAGEGPEKQRLKSLAQADSRILFLGRINDQQVIKEYAGALFIPFIPYDEDYGLITIEAMKSQKPILTTTDAGGVNEFVEQGVSGYSVAPDIKSLTAAMNKLINNPQKCSAMGQRALLKVAHVDWHTTVQKLIQPGDVNATISKDTRKMNLVVALTFSCWPPRGGGQIRVYNLYKQLAQEHNVTLLALVNPDVLQTQTDYGLPNNWQDRMIAPNLREILIAKSPEQISYQSELEVSLNASIDDIACIHGYRLTPRYGEVLQVLAESADVFVACHPYLYNAIREHWQGELWYEAQDVEIDLKQSILSAAPNSAKWLQEVRDIEASCCQASQQIMTCSETDAQRVSSLYEQALDKIKVVANGVAVAPEIKGILNILDDKSWSGFICLFMGSWHGPNIEALEQIKKIANKTPKIHYLILGSVCQHKVCQQLPANCYPLGMVSESEKDLYQQIADIAVNPMLSGSGTNLKMLDYTANNLPVLSTKFGLRGLDFIEDQEVIVAPVSEFAAKLNQLYFNRYSEEQQQALKQMASQAKHKTLQQYQWSSIAEVMKKMLEQRKSFIVE